MENSRKDLNFINDREKIKDMKKLSKKEFLESYSYLTEEEYNNTQKIIANMIHYCNFYIFNY